jgi:lipopolysaccharide transport system permease protein
MSSAVAERVSPWEYCQRVWRFRHFFFSLVRMDLRSRYRRSYLGFAWSLIRPLSMCAVLCLVFTKVFNVSIATYAPFLLIGLTMWQFVLEATLTGCQSFTTSASYIRQQPLPLAIFPLRVVLGAGFHAAITFAVVILFTWLFQFPGNVFALISLIPFFVLLFLLAWFMAIISGVGYAYFPDTQYLIDIGFQILFYLTPVIYPPEMLRSRGHLSWFLELNPLTHFLDMVRQPVLHGHVPGMRTYLVASATVAGLGVLAAFLLKKVERTLVFRLGTRANSRGGEHEVLGGFPAWL